MAARPLRRPKPLTDLFPEARLKEITDLLGSDNPNLRSLQKLLAEERSLGQRLSEPDTLIPDLPDTAVLPPDDVAGRAELLLLAVPDAELAGLVSGLAATSAVRPGTIVAHTSGGDVNGPVKNTIALRTM